ncbi:MAG TPA: hypothetical protein DEB06_07715 [Phycisphaerales bacterium]|nr:hypothetical protein [Phycisphaerales bacterium]
MINMPRLVRLACDGHFDAMLGEVVRNGRPLPLSVRLRLSQPDSLAPAALGLALQRVLELTYRPTDTSVSLLRELLARALPDGSFGSVSATAIALAALLGFEHQVNSLPGARTGDGSRYIDPALRATLQRAIADALGRLGAQWALGERTDGHAALLGDDIDTAVVLWQLAFCPAFGRVVPLGALFESAEANGLLHDRRTAPLVSGSALALRVAPERAA